MAAPSTANRQRLPSSPPTGLLRSMSLKFANFSERELRWRTMLMCKWMESTLACRDEAPPLAPLPVGSSLELLERLRDGIMLARLVNALSPGTIPRVVEEVAPVMALQQALENVQGVLRACRDVFHLPEGALFRETDVIGPHVDDLHESNEKLKRIVFTVLQLASVCAEGDCALENKLGNLITETSTELQYRPADPPAGTQWDVEPILEEEQELSPPAESPLPAAVTPGQVEEREKKELTPIPPLRVEVYSTRKNVVAELRVFMKDLEEEIHQIRLMIQNQVFVEERTVEDLRGEFTAFMPRCRSLLEGTVGRVEDEIRIRKELERKNTDLRERLTSLLESTKGKLLSQPINIADTTLHILETTLQQAIHDTETISTAFDRNDQTLATLNKTLQRWEEDVAHPQLQEYARINHSLVYYVLAVLVVVVAVFLLNSNDFFWGGRFPPYPT